MNFSTAILSNWVTFSIKNVLLFEFLIFLENIPLLLEVTNSVNRVLNFFNGFNNVTISNNENILNKVNPIFYIKEVTLSASSNEYSSFSNSIIISIILIFLTTLIFFSILIYIQNKDNNISRDEGFYSQKSEEEKSNRKKYFLFYFFINFFDFCFKNCGFFILFILTHKIIFGIVNNSDYSIIIISIIFLFIFIYFYYYMIENILLYVKFNKEIKFHYDLFSRKYDYLIFMNKILVCIICNIEMIPNYTKHNFSLLIDLIIVGSFFVFTIINLDEIYLITIANFELNLFRVYLLTNDCLILLTYFLFESIYSIVTLTTICLILISIVALLLICFIQNRLKTSLVEMKHDDCNTESKLLIYKVAYFLNIYIGDSEKFEDEISKLKLLHGTNCKKQSDCYICYSSSEEFILSMLDTIQTSEAKDKSLTLEEIKMVCIIDLICREQLQNKNNINNADKNTIKNYLALYKTRELLKRFSVSNTSVTPLCSRRRNVKIFQSNLNLFFYFLQNRRDSGNSQSIQTYHNFSLLKKYDESLQILQKSVDNIKDVILCFDTNAKKDLYPVAKDLNNAKEKLMSNLYDFYSFKNTFCEPFSLITIKFAFEKTFNQTFHFDLDDNQFDYDFQLDLIKDHFRFDKVMIIHYNAQDNSFIIKRASRYFFKYKNNHFEDIFAPEFKLKAKQIMTEILNSNEDKITFDFFIPFKEEFITSFKLNCSVFRSFNLDEIFIIADFEMSKEDLIIFEENGSSSSTSKDNYPHEKLYNINLRNNLFSYSENLQKTFIFTPNEFKENKRVFKKKISFNDMMGRTDNRNKEDYYFYYMDYFKNILSNENNNINQVISRANTEDTDLHGKINELHQSAQLNKSLNLKVIYKYSVELGEFKRYRIYSVLISKRKISFNFNDDSYTDTVSLNISDNFSQIMSHHSGTIRSLSSQNSKEVKLQKKRKLQTYSEKNITLFKRLTVCVNMLLIIYSFVFVFIGLQGNSIIQDAFAMDDSFNTLEHAFYQTTLSLFYNVAVYPQNTSDNTEHSECNKFSQINLTIPINDYANSEFHLKLDFIKSNLLDLQSYIYNSKYKDKLTSKFELKTKVYSMNYDGDELILSQQLVNFLDSITLYINNGKMAAFNSTYTMINILNFRLEDESFDFSSIVNKNLSSIQKGVYEIIMNYPNYYKNFNRMNKIVEELYHQEIYAVINLNWYVSLTLIGLHSLSILISVAIIKYFIKTTEENNLLLSKMITNKREINKNHSSYKVSGSKALLSKLDIIEKILKFYSEEPNKLYDKFKELKINSNFPTVKTYNKFATQSSAKDKENEGSIITEKEKLHETVLTKVYIINQVFSLVKFLFYLYGLYFIYSFIFIFLFTYTIDRLILTSDYLSDYTHRDYNSINSIILLQSLIYSNQTDSSLARFLHDDSYFTYDYNFNKGYISEMIEENRRITKFLEVLHAHDPDYNIIKAETDKQVDCEYLYTNVTDEIIEPLSLKYSNKKELKENLIKVCNQFPIIKTKIFSNIMEDFDFTAKKMINMYNFAYGDYAKMREISEDEEFEDKFTMEALFVRPLQNYMVDHYIHDRNIQSEQIYLLIVICYLISNIAIDILIFDIINRYFINGVLSINKEVKCLTGCLSE